jgi:gliding motility-associated lipoprotein GldH
MAPQIAPKRIIHSFFIGLGLLLIGCNSNSLYNQYRTFHSDGWDKDSVAHFSFAVHDTLSRYNVIVNLRYLATYPYQNFWMFINETSSDGTLVKDTVECYLADERGRWLGRGFSVFSMPVLIAHDKQFKHAGNYTFVIRQGMRDDVLVGIAAIGLEIDK